MTGLFDPAAQAVQHTHAHQMSDDALADKMVHNAHITPALGALVVKPDVSQDDIVLFLHKAMQRGIMTEDQAGKFFNQLPKNPRHMKGALHNMHQVAVHAGTILKAEVHRRRQS